MTEPAVPGAVERAKTSGITLDDVIDRYIRESTKDFGKTKKQVLAAIRTYDIAKSCDQIDSAAIVEFARLLLKDRLPQTVGNYISHLASVFAIARPAWNYPLSQQAMKDAQALTNRPGVTSKSQARSRRPTPEELDKFMEHFDLRSKRRPDSAPMTKIIAFAIFSTRRLEEITRIAWPDLVEEGKRILVRDMKNPGEKIGNHVWCDLPAEALQVILGVEDLYFHDLRHEGVSRLFEMGLNIPHAAAVSGHRSWNSLKRYTHLRQIGDKYANWKWLSEIAPIVEEAID